jgi:hypothetical protein
MGEDNLKKSYWSPSSLELFVLNFEYEICSFINFETNYVHIGKYVLFRGVISQFEIQSIMGYKKGKI